MKSKYDPYIHHRHSIRLKGYDYSQAGAYFVTMVTQGREPFFGEVVEGEMRLNRYGEIVCEEWERTPEIRPEVELGAYVVMPNHVHGILIFHAGGVFTVGATRRAAPTTKTLISGSLGAIMAQFKSIVTKRINTLRNTPGETIWQRNYYDHILRNQQDLELTWLYIETNPARWGTDRENPEAVES
jgi:REP element-mobilizing transposase RayT